MELTKLEPKSNDSGTFVEAFKFPNDGQLSYLVVKPGERRGEHFHERKTEYFSVIYGNAKIVVKDRDTGDVMDVKLNGNRPMVAKITPNNTHYLEAGAEGCITLIWCDEQFEEADPDTFQEEL